MAIPAILGVIARGAAARGAGGMAIRSTLFDALGPGGGPVITQAPQIDYKVKSNIDEVVRDLRAVNSKVIDKAVVRTLNRVITSCKSVGVKAIAKETGLKQKTVRPKVELEKANFLKQEAHAVPSGRPFRLIHFNARQTAAGVSANAWAVKRVYPHTFIADVAAGSGRTEGVFVRKTAERYPIRQLYGPGVKQTFAKPHILKVLENRADERFNKEFEANLKFYMEKEKARRR